MNLPVPDGFEKNTFKPSNDPIRYLFDSLSVINYSLDLIKYQGRHEFNNVIAIELRSILTKSNDVYDDKKYEKAGLSYNKNKFSLFDLLQNFTVATTGEVVSELRLFPKFDYNNAFIRNESHLYYRVNNAAIYDHSTLTLSEFLSQTIVALKDIDENTVEKDIEYAIKKIANKGNGAHYQHFNNKLIMQLLLQKDMLIQNIGYMTVQSLLPVVNEVLKYLHLEDYNDRSIFQSFEGYSPLPIYKDKN